MAHSTIMLPLAIGIVAAVLGLWAYSLVKQEQAAWRSGALSDRTLYETGRRASAEARKAESSALAVRLRRAGIDVSPVTWTSATVASAFLLYALASAVSGSGLVAAAAAAAGPAAAFLRLGTLRKKRRALLEEQFASLLPQVAANVRSSLTLERALRSAVAHVDEPLREEMGRVLGDAAYGSSLPDSLELMATRTGNPDVKAFAAATRIQQKFGGSVSSVLGMIASHANARLKASRELRTEIAGTRLAKWFVASAMPAMFLTMYVANADFARFYATEPLGWTVLGLAAASEAFGLLACQRITSLEKDVS